MWPESIDEYGVTIPSAFIQGHFAISGPEVLGVGCVGGGC
jgi:hypothetical protein